MLNPNVFIGMDVLKRRPVITDRNPHVEGLQDVHKCIYLPSSMDKNQYLPNYLNQNILFMVRLQEIEDCSPQVLCLRSCPALPSSLLALLLASSSPLLNLPAVTSSWLMTQIFTSTGYSGTEIPLVSCNKTNSLQDQQQESILTSRLREGYNTRYLMIQTSYDDFYLLGSYT